MQIQPIDLTEIIAVFMGISIVLVPIIGITIRFALKPAVEALSQLMESRGREESIQILERRIGLLESQMEALEGSMTRLEDTVTFDSQLQAGSTEEDNRLPPP